MKLHLEEVKMMVKIDDDAVRASRDKLVTNEDSAVLIGKVLLLGGEKT